MLLQCMLSTVCSVVWIDSECQQSSRCCCCCYSGHCSSITNCILIGQLGHLLCICCMQKLPSGVTSGPHWAHQSSAANLPKSDECWYPGRHLTRVCSGSAVSAMNLKSAVTQSDSCFCSCCLSLEVLHGVPDCTPRCCCCCCNQMQLS